MAEPKHRKQLCSIHHFANKLLVLTTYIQTQRVVEKHYNLVVGAKGARIDPDRFHRICSEVAQAAGNPVNTNIPQTHHLLEQRVFC